MSMNFNKNIFSNIVPPAYILTKANSDRIHTLDCLEKKYYFKFNAPDVIQFKTYMLIDNLKNPVYDSIVEGQFVEVEDLGRFILSSANIISQGHLFEYKDCEAIGTEVMLGQKYLELFTINMGTTESIDEVKFYNLSNPEKSLLHLALEKCPDWTIGHVDTSLITLERCFEVTRQDVYSFLTQDVATAFQCVFLFDTLHQRINVYSEENVGSDTDIFVTYDNLLKNTNISSSIDNIKTCLTVIGADDLNLREVNMGYDKIHMLDYFHSLEFMSQGLYDAYGRWVKKWNDNISNYSSLLSQYQNYYNQINDITHKKMPSNPDSTNWSEYGLVPLQEKLATFEQRQAVMIKAGQGNKDHKDYYTMYLPVYNAINSIKSQISVVENQISVLKSQQSSIGKQMGNIIVDIDMKNNFTHEQLSELNKFIREDELSTQNFVVTDTMTDSERMDMLKEMLEFGQKELSKVSQPQIQFSAEMLNLFEIEEFQSCSVNFEPGNYINIILRDDYIVKARLLTIDLDFYHPDNFSVTFGNMNKAKGKNIYTDTMRALDTATSVATTVSFNSSNWNQANKDADDINKALASGLLTSIESLRTSKSDVIIDDRGITVSNTPESKYPNDRIFIGNSSILFSDDDFKSIKTALGRVKYTKKGVTYDDFGLLAQFVLAGFIAGSIIEASEFYGGILQSLNYIAGKTGTKIDLNKGTFEFNANGESKLTLDRNGVLTVKGIVKAEEGWIGGQNAFIIKDGKLYSGKDSFSSAASGVYIGIDGIALGANNAFSVDPQGNLIAKIGTIGNIKIDSNRIYSDNGNFQITSGGYGEFKDVSINGVRPNSSFGSIGYNGSTTWGNFGGTSYFGSSVGSPFSGTCVTHIENLAVGQITADRVKAKALEAGFITAETISANYATIGSLDAAVAEIERLYVKSADIDSLIANKIKASSISANQITSGSMSVSRLTAGTVNGRSVDWQMIKYVQRVDSDFVTINGTKVVNKVQPIFRHLYVMAQDSD